MPARSTPWAVAVGQRAPSMYASLSKTSTSRLRGARGPRTASADADIRALPSPSSARTRRSGSASASPRLTGRTRPTPAERKLPSPGRRCAHCRDEAPELATTSPSPIQEASHSRHSYRRITRLSPGVSSSSEQTICSVLAVANTEQITSKNLLAAPRHVLRRQRRGVDGLQELRADVLLDELQGADLAGDDLLVPLGLEAIHRAVADQVGRARVLDAQRLGQLDPGVRMGPQVLHPLDVAGDDAGH